MLASLASVSISVTNVLAVETSERMVHRRCHRALVARMPEALAATLHPEHKLPPPSSPLHPHATCTIAVFLLHKVMSARKAGRVLPEPVWKSNVRRPTGAARPDSRRRRAKRACNLPNLCSASSLGSFPIHKSQRSVAVGELAASKTLAFRAQKYLKVPKST